VVQAWLSAPAPTCVTETETDPQPEEPATAEIVHDGTAAAAHHTGSLAEGYRETLQALAAALGGTAQEYGGTYTIVELPAMRATAGRLANASVSC